MPSNWHHVGRCLGDLQRAVRQRAAGLDPADTSFERYFGEGMTDPKHGFQGIPERLAMPSYWGPFGNDLRYRARADWQGTDPRIIQWSQRFIQRLKKGYQIPVYVHTAFRDQATQAKVIVAGNSKAKWPNSPHNRGAAVDLVHGRYHWEMTRKEWEFLGKIGHDVHDELQRELPKSERWRIIWGGKWSFWDPAHWEIDGWKETHPSISEDRPMRLHAAPDVALKAMRDGRPYLHPV